MKSKAKVWMVSIIGIVVVIVSLAGVKVGQIRAMIQAGQSFAPPPEAVTSARAEAAVWKLKRSAIGTLVAVHDAVLGAELPGLIREVAFASGTTVRRGALMVKLDTTTEEAQLASAKADMDLALATLARARALRKGEANTPADLDAAEARAKQTRAAVANIQTTIAKKTIRAPFDGRVAFKQVERGQVVSPGTTIATLQSVDPIYAEFSSHNRPLQISRSAKSRPCGSTYSRARPGRGR